MVLSGMPGTVPQAWETQPIEAELRKEHFCAAEMDDDDFDEDFDEDFDDEDFDDDFDDDFEEDFDE